MFDSGAEVTVVRASWFQQNFGESFLLDGVLAGEVVFPADGSGSRSSTPTTSPTWPSRP